MVLRKILNLLQTTLVLPPRALALLLRPQPQRLKTAMATDQLLVRCVEGEEFMTLSYSYGDKQSNLLRSQAEPLDKSLMRLETNVRKLGRPKKRHNKKMKCEHERTEAVNAGGGGSAAGDQAAGVPCSLLVDGAEVAAHLPNRDAWVEGAVLRLGVRTYRVSRNLPTILSLKLPNCVLAGCPIYPRVEFEFARPDACTYVWYREVVQDIGPAAQISVGPSRAFPLTSPDEQSPVQAVPMPMDTGGAADGVAVQIPVTINPSPASQVRGYERRWVRVSESKVYTPSMSEEGSLLKIVCLPGDGERVGAAKEVQTTSAVRRAPDSFPFETRHNHTKDKTPDDCMRVVSYNILADMYADSDFSRDVLYPYCPKEVLEIDYREQLILKELAGYNADILCLQEVGRRLFENSLVPSLENVGLSGLLRCKHGNLAEGEAIFYRTDKFRLLGSHDVVFCEALEKDPAHRRLLEAVVQSKAMLKRFLGLAAVAQVAVLEHISDPSRRLCVANTHLYFHPRAAHIRLVQTAIMLQHVEKVCSLYQEPGNSRPAILLCGDLNSNPDSGVYEYLTKGSVAQNSVEWYTSGKEEFCGGLALDHALQLSDACPDVRYTNFVASFQGKLDHVLFEADRMDVRRVVPVPTHEEVTRHVALPNAVFPSDHMALVCELAWAEGL